ncbi:DEAD/DEAH box helicase [Pseudobdellovibrio sp. HCB154]|uniref:DEAD/DEAH box helicase n=1 Tax=Pseudobdellovibrio sp. HCB154 TaxID=3386277 RepID=UPI003917509D
MQKDQKSPSSVAADATTTKLFSDLELIEPLQRALRDLNYEKPTPIQEKSIPILLAGKDLLGCAQTGTGKTAAFALPLLQNLAKSKNRPRHRQALVLVLAPTRELALQIHQSFEDYGRYLDLKTAVIFGGVGQGPQVKALSMGVDVLVATPGRLFDLLEQKHVYLDKVQAFVLDEADRMMDMGFIADIQRIIKILPKQRHNLFFSATMPPDISKLANNILVNPEKVEVTPAATTAEKIEQWLMYVDKPQKRDLLKFLLDDKAFKRVIVFTRTKHGANRVAEVLQKSKITSAAIHGNKSQSARQRALEEFRSGHCRVLIATDIAARGIDVDDITHVINFEIPNIPENYVHRIGRTARAGREGIAISFCDSEEKSFIRDIEKATGKAIPVVTQQPYHSKAVELAQLMSPGKAKAKLEAAERGGGGGGRRNRNRRGGGGGQRRNGGNGGGGGSRHKSGGGQGKPSSKPSR